MKGLSLSLFLLLGIFSSRLVYAQERPTYSASRVTQREAEFFEHIAEKYFELIDLNVIIYPKIQDLPPFRRWIRERVRELINTQRFVRFKIQNLSKRHPEFLAIQQMFRVIKLFVVFPILIKAGYAHFIPQIEISDFLFRYSSVIYFFTKRQIQNIWGMIRYSHTYTGMDSFSEDLLRTEVINTINYHHFEWEGESYTLFSRRRRLIETLKIKLRHAQSPLIYTEELESLIDDRDWLFHAKKYMSNDYVYENMLLRKILTTQEATHQLMQKVSPGPHYSIHQNVFLSELYQQMALSMDLIHQGNYEINRHLRMQLGIPILYLNPISRRIKIIIQVFRRKVIKDLQDLENLQYDYISHLMDNDEGGIRRYEARYRRIQRRLSLHKNLFLSMVERVLATQDKFEAQTLVNRYVQHLESEHRISCPAYLRLFL